MNIETYQSECKRSSPIPLLRVMHVWAEHTFTIGNCSMEQTIWQAMNNIIDEKESYIINIELVNEIQRCRLSKLPAIDSHFDRWVSCSAQSEFAVRQSCVSQPDGEDWHCYQFSDSSGIQFDKRIYLINYIRERGLLLRLTSLEYSIMEVGAEQRMRIITKTNWKKTHKISTHRDRPRTSSVNFSQSKSTNEIRSGNMLKQRQACGVYILSDHYRMTKQGYIPRLGRQSARWRRE